MAKNRTVSSVAANPVAASSRIQTMIASSTVDRTDGHAVPVLRASPSDSAHQGRWGIDVSKAPVPQRRYAAELCAIVHDKFEARLIFGQRCLVGEELESALVVRMTLKALREFSESLLVMNIESMQADLQLPDEELTTITSHPNQTASMVANLVSVAIADHETCLDFYHASAFAIAKIQKQHKLEVEPIVRVDIRTSLFIPFVRELNTIATGI